MFTSTPVGFCTFTSESFMQPSNHILPCIVLAQFCCTSLWFASNAISPDLIDAYHLTETSLGYLTAAVQIGFIIGTLGFAFAMIADRFSPIRVFFVGALVGSLINLALLWESNSLASLLTIRFLVGCSLAAIYPVGMKIAADHFNRRLGNSLGFLVGALVLGTAFPHSIKAFSADVPWKTVVYVTSGLAVVGGLILVLFVPNGPYRKPAAKLRLNAFLAVFKNRRFRAAAFGYFGHMWELYAFWTFVPLCILGYNTLHPTTSLSVPFWSFCIIGIGAIGCVLAGLLVPRYNEKRLATFALSISGLFCLASPLLFEMPVYVFLILLLVWGMVVIADSPMFSTLVAQRAPSEVTGTALTIVNCIGFAITIVSIQLLASLSEALPISYLFVVLAFGPLFGLISLRRLN